MAGLLPGCSTGHACPCSGGEGGCNLLYARLGEQSTPSSDRHKRHLIICGDTRCGYPSGPLRGEKDVVMAYKNPNWHSSVVVKVDFKVMCLFLLTIKCPS